MRKWTPEAQIHILQNGQSYHQSTLKRTQTLAKQTPPGTTNRLATTEVSQDRSSWTTSTSNVAGIDVAMSTKEQHPHRGLRQGIAT